MNGYRLYPHDRALFSHHGRAAPSRQAADRRARAHRARAHAAHFGPCRRADAGFRHPAFKRRHPDRDALAALDAALVGERALHPPAAADLRQPDGAHFRWQGAAGRNAPQPLHARRAHRGTPLSGRDGPHKRQIRGARNRRAALCPPLSRRAARNA